MGAVLLRPQRWRKFGLGLLSLGTIALLACGFGPVGAALTIPLEQRFPVLQDLSKPPAGIIVLGGGVKSRSPMANPDLLPLNSAGERITALIYLAHKYPDAQILFSGGVGDLLDFGMAEADEVQHTIAALGIDPARIIFENKSRNTFENAVFSKVLAKPKQGERWLLVTSAWHMPRSMGCFTQAGFEVEAFPVDFRTNGWADTRHPTASVAAGLQMTDVAFREWLGLVAYRLTNKTNALFPN